MSKATYNPPIGLLNKWQTAEKYGDYKGLFDTDPTLEGIFDIIEKGTYFFDEGPGSCTRSGVATRINENSEIVSCAANEARFDHDPETGKLIGLLNEKSSTNLFTTSETFTAFAAVNASIGSPASASPISGVDWKALTEDSSTNAHYYPVTGVCLSGNKYSASILVKPDGRDYITLWFASLSTTYSARFNLSDGTKAFEGSDVTASIKKMGTNGFLCTIQTDVALSGNSSLTLYLHDSDTSTTSYTGDGVSGIYMQGYQIEPNESPTSYIPTFGTTVPRLEDEPLVNGQSFTDFFNENEGTWLVVVSSNNFDKATSSDQQLFIFTRDLTDATKRHSIGRYNGGSNGFNYYIQDGADQAYLVSSYTDQVTLKFAASYKLNDVATYLDGGDKQTDSSATMPTGFDELTIGYKSSSPSNNINGHIKRVVYFPVALNDEQLSLLTTTYNY